VESLSKSIAIEELKPVVVEILRELFDPDEIEIILPREEREFGGIIWRRSENKIDRRMVRNDPYHDQILAWMKGDLTEELISGDRREVIMPVIRGDNRLALIVVRYHKSQFDELGLGLVKAVGSHIAVAFENAALYHIAITDELTGLFSKRHFWSSMEKKFSLFERYGEKLTILMLDIDDFKKVNDTHGHPAGDQVLKEVAQCILLSTRDGDLSCRYGGEEFTVILPATDSAAGSIVAERIRALIDTTVFRHEQIEMRLTVSIGLANCPENARTIRDMIVESDKALYEAKRTGKNRITLSRARTS
jgi:diguanylate cyclase (GGDEF)-like protein